MAKKVLVVDDEQQLLALLEMSLGDEGYEVLTAASAGEAMEVLRGERPDLIVLDVMLPDVSGMKLTGQLKNTAETAEIPIILLTAKDAETDMIVGFNMGADDYVTKPFSMGVLIARIDAVLRRRAQVPGTAKKQTLEAGTIRVIPSSRRVEVDGEEVELTPAEFAILEALMRAGGAIVSRDELMAAIGSSEAESAERIINVHISSLRKKLGDARKYVKTVHSAGYRLET